MRTCPACRNQVEPRIDGHGAPACPVCGWYPGRNVQAAPVPAYAELDAAPRAASTAPGAVPALILGLLGLCLFPLALVLAPVAFALGAKAVRRVRTSEGRLQGASLAVTGMALGAVGLAAALIVGAFVTLVVLAEMDDTLDIEGTVVLTDETWTEAFRTEVPGTVHLEVYADADMRTSIVRVADRAVPEPYGDERWGEGSGTAHKASAFLEPGLYGVWVECAEPGPCTAQYRLYFVPLEDEADTRRAGNLTIGPDSDQYIAFRVDQATDVHVDVVADAEVTVGIFEDQELLWYSSSTSVQATQHLGHGLYSLSLRCDAAVPCHVGYRVGPEAAT